MNKTFIFDNYEKFQEAILKLNARTAIKYDTGSEIITGVIPMNGTDKDRLREFKGKDEFIDCSVRYPNTKNYNVYIYSQSGATSIKDDKRRNVVVRDFRGNE